jgi:glyoxylase I family protein
MAQPFIEHVNVTVSDPERSARMLQDLFGWEVRWRGPAQSGGRTIHVGSASCYLALYADPGEVGAPKGFRKGAPLNPVGVEVEDLEAVEARACELGLKPFNKSDYAPGRRFYLFDADGIEFEIVSYAPPTSPGV